MKLSGIRDAAAPTVAGPRSGETGVATTPNPRVWRTDSADDGTREGEETGEGGGTGESRSDSEATTGRHWRTDNGTLLHAHRTTEGYLLAEGLVARPGVYEYRKPDGSKIRELVLPEELHRDDSLATLGRKPLTLEHPEEPVGPANVERYGVGDVDGDVEKVSLQEGGYVRVKFAVRRADALAAIEDDGVRELSPGYDCRIDATPGTHPVYGAYDQIQRDRRYNHLALTMAARGGHSIRFRLDTYQIDGRDVRFDSVAAQVPHHPSDEAPMNPKLLILLATLLGAPNVKTRKDADGRREDADEATIDAAIQKANEMGAKLAELLPIATTAEELRGQIATLKTKVGELEGKLKAAEEAATSAPSPEAIVESAAETDPVEMMDAAAAAAATPEMKRLDAARKAIRTVGAERERLLTLASRFRVDAKEAEKLGLAGLRKVVVIAANPQARKDGDAAYYRAAVDMLPATQARTDAAADRDDPYAGISDAYRRDRDDRARDADDARRDDGADREDADPIKVYRDNIEKARVAARAAAPTRLPVHGR